MRSIIFLFYLTVLFCPSTASVAGQAFVEREQDGEESQSDGKAEVETPRCVPQSRLRVIVETDAGGDPDDEQSLVRFLLYCNEWDVEGIICNRPKARERENLNPERTGLGIVQRMLTAYSECYPQLVKHDPRYPQPEVLQQRTVSGYATNQEGVDLIVAAVDSPDPRPVWFMNWGTDDGSSPSNLKRALDQVLAERGPEGYRTFKDRLRISGDDRFGKHTTELLPSFRLWVDTKQPGLEGKRWYQRFSPLTAKAGGFDLTRDVLNDHGPLGAMYPTNSNLPQKEGDTTEFLYLVPTGMNEPEQPTWGSWAGRYGPKERQADRAEYWANAADNWEGTTHRENSLRRWAVDFQNDFRARLDWCVAEYQNANHPPAVVVNGCSGSDILHVSGFPGEVIRLDATLTSDPDTDALEFHWFNYPEAGTYSGAVRLSDSSRRVCELTIPADALGKSMHLVLAVHDTGTPQLARYRRIVIHCRATAKKEMHTRASIQDGKWFLNDVVTYAGSSAEGLLMNVRMVNAVFEDANESTCPNGFDASANTDCFVSKVPDYVANGIRGFTLCLQGGSCGYEGAVNSAFKPDGSLRSSYMERVSRVIEACDRHGAVVILGCFYQRQDQHIESEAALRTGVANVAKWIGDQGYTNVVLEIANEFSHAGFDHRLLKSDSGEKELIQIAKRANPKLLASTSGLGNGKFPPQTAEVADVLLVHFNNTTVEDIPVRLEELKKYGKPIVCNEDDKQGKAGAQAARLCVQGGASWGLMLVETNQHYPFTFKGAADDLLVYGEIKQLTTAEDYFPVPESEGGWRKLEVADEIEKQAGMDPIRLMELRDWLLASDDRDFAAVVIRRGYIVLEVERGNGVRIDSGRVASVSKAVCATVLAIAAERSQLGLTRRKMSFDDRAFQYIPWAEPLTDPGKSHITVRQLLNHTSGICPEATGAKNDGRWEYVLGLDGNANTKMLAFEPGTGCGYSTHAFCHASLVCESVVGKPYDEFAIESLFRPIGCERWWFQYYDGGEKIGRHPSHGLGMPARDLARIGYCMLRNGRWNKTQIIPQWFVRETAAATHEVKTPEWRWKVNPQTFSHGWELPAMHWPESQKIIQGIPADARYKPGSGGQILAFVPSLDLVIARQTGGSGSWHYEEFLQRACAAVMAKK
jgi:CubicO group peptidase (beta-lactamase class C family)